MLFHGKTSSTPSRWATSAVVRVSLPTAPQPILCSAAETYAALHESVRGLQRLHWWSVANLLQIGGGALVCLSALAFIQFLRNVSGCFNDRARDWSLGVNSLAAGVLLGGSIGAVFCFADLEGRAEPTFFLSWLWVGAWLRALPKNLEMRLVVVKNDGKVVGLF